MNPYRELSRACYNGNLAEVKRLIAAGADINAPEEPGGYTPLLRASQQDHIAIANCLLERGADHSYRAKGGYTAFHTSKTEILESLANAGAVPTEEDTLWLLNWFHGRDWIKQYLEGFPVSIAQWRDSPYHLYHRILSSGGDRLFEEILQPALPMMRDVIEELQVCAKYGETPRLAYLDDKTCNLNALGYVLDLLLLNFQPDPLGHTLETGRVFRNCITIEQYQYFIRNCGLEVFLRGKFSSRVPRNCLRHEHRGPCGAYPEDRQRLARSSPRGFNH